MNKNLVKYPIRFGTLLLAGAALVACKKEEFTEANALTLEKDRLTFLNDQRNANMLLAEKERNRLITWQRSMDSLDRINAGGRVFYTVIPVAANETTFSGGGNTGGGRTEEAITNAVVTISQYGRAFSNATPAGTNVGSALNGVYTFSELRSGEVSVKVQATGFTELNYVANLTPDGGIPNQGTINVGNVVPLFEIAAPISSNKMAVIKGRAFFEGDLTNTVAGSSVVGAPDLNAGITDELVTSTILGANNSGVGGTSNLPTNLVTATIDVTRNDGSINGLPYFHQRFITESNGEGVNAFGVRVQSGAIQRFSYSKAVTYGTVNATGDYAMLIPASAAGLPIRLNYSEFAFNRTYWNAAGNLVTNERFLYGPNVIPTDIPQPTFATPTLSVRAYDAAAGATATFTPQSTATQPTNFNSALVNTLANTNPNFVRAGFYATAPTVTVAGVGTLAAFTANLDGTAPFRLNTAALYKGTDNVTGFLVPATNKTEFETSFKTVGVIDVTNGGSGYAANGALTFTRTDIVTAAGFGGQATGSGTAGGYVALSLTTPIQVTDGGANFNFQPVVATGISSANTFTNYLPTVFFTENNQSGSADPDRGYTGLIPSVTAATARVFVDYNAGYTGTPFLGVTSPNTGGNGVGAIQEVRMTGAGAYPNATLPFVNFSFGERVNTVGFLANAAPAVGGKNLFISAGPGLVKFNPAMSTAELERVFATGVGSVATSTPTSVDFAANNGWGSRYTYVPRIELDANTAAILVTGAAVDGALRSMPIVASVSNDPISAAFGKIIKIQLTQAPIAGLNSGADNNDFLSLAPFSVGTTTIGLRVTPQRYGNTLAAIGGGTAGRTVAIGSALNTYSYTASAQTASAATNLAVAMGGAKSNTTMTNLSTAEYLAGNNMLVAFDAPNNMGVTGRRHAWGVPVFVVDNTGAVGNVLAGARIIDGGSGYNAPTVGAVNFTSNITAQLVPNPWYRTNVPVTAIAGPANVTSALGGGITTNADVLGFLNHPAMTAQGTAFRPTPAITRARLKIDFTGGSSYSVAPRFVFPMPGFNLVEYDAAAAPIATGNAVTPFITTSAGGVITFNTKIDATGKVIQVGNGTTVGFAPGAGPNATTAGLTQLQRDGVDVPNEFEFPVNRGLSVASITTTGIMIEELSVALTNSLNSPFATGSGVGARVVIGTTGTGAAITGAVTGVTFRDGTLAELPNDGAIANNARSPQVEISTNLTPLPDTKLVPAPFRISVVGGRVGGTEATLQGYVTVDPNVLQHRRITRIAVTNGGSGYGVQRTNSWFRASGGGLVVIPGGTGNTTVPASGNGAPGQPFTLFGNFGNGTQQGQNQTNMQFDAYPGLTYVRDVHYGTGQRLD